MNDFTFCSLMIGQPSRPAWFLCAWTKAGQTWIDEHQREYERYGEYCIIVTKLEVQDLLTAVANADLAIAGMDVSHRKENAQTPGLVGDSEESRPRKDGMHLYGSKPRGWKPRAFNRS